MSQRLRVSLVITGLIVMLVSLAILAYAAWPAYTAREQTRLAPTVFVSP